MGTTGHIIKWVVAASAMLLATGVASAHPHVRVTMTSEIVYGSDGAVTSVRHAWTFDKEYSDFATQGIDAKTRGEFSREELAPLAKENAESMKEFRFFTNARADRRAVTFLDPVGYAFTFDSKTGMLTFQFVLPLRAPVKSKDLSLDIYDPSYFVAFTLAPGDAVKLVGAPDGCTLNLTRPPPLDAATSARLSRVDEGGEAAHLGAQFANRIAVKCP